MFGCMAVDVDSIVELAGLAQLTNRLADGRGDGLVVALLMGQFSRRCDPSLLAS